MQQEERKVKCVSQTFVKNEKDSLIKKSISDSILTSPPYSDDKQNVAEVISQTTDPGNNSIKAVTELFLENNIQDIFERDSFRQELVSNGDLNDSEKVFDVTGPAAFCPELENATESGSSSMEDEIVEMRPNSTSNSRQQKTNTAIVSAAFGFLQNESSAATVMEDDIDMIRIPPEGCESTQTLTLNCPNGNRPVIREIRIDSDDLNSSFDDTVEDEIVNFSRSSMEIDGCESETDDQALSTSSNAVAGNLAANGIDLQTVTLNTETDNFDTIETDISLNVANEFHEHNLLSSNNDFLDSQPQPNCDVSETVTDSPVENLAKSSNQKAPDIVTNNDSISAHLTDQESCNNNHSDQSENATNDTEVKLSNQKPCDLVKDNLTNGETEDLSRIVLRRQSGRKQKHGDRDEEISDDSSDEDSGIYAESHRNSTWIQLEDDQLMNTGIDKQQSTTDETVQKSTGTNTILRLVSEDETVFSDSTLGPPVMGHRRSESTSTTLSETEFKRERSYKSRRRCLIRRQESQQEYHRMSAKVFDQEKLVVIEKNETDVDFGLHILDSHPAFITSVDPGSPAERCGIQEGQIVISVNGINTLELGHDDIVKLVQKSQRLVRLEVAYSDFTPVRDLQKSVMSGFMLKLGTSTLVKMWKKRYFVLRQDNCLYYYKNIQELDPLGAIPLSGYCISRYIDTTKDYCFKAEKYGARTYYFMTDNREEMSTWVGVLTEAAARCKKRKDSWLEVSSHNVGLPALEIRKPECTGTLMKLGQQHKTWQKRYCVLKDACIYYYKSMNSLSAKGVVHLHGYTVDGNGSNHKKYSFILNPPESSMRTFCFSTDNQTDKQRWVDCLIRSIQRWIRVDS